MSLDKLIIVHETLRLRVILCWDCELSGPVQDRGFISSYLETKEVQNVLFDTVIEGRLVLTAAN